MDRGAWWAIPWGSQYRHPGKNIPGAGTKRPSPRKSAPACEEVAGGRVTAGDRGPETPELPSLQRNTSQAAGAGLLAVGCCETPRRMCLRFRSQGVAAGTSV